MQHGMRADMRRIATRREQIVLRVNVMMDELEGVRFELDDEAASGSLKFFDRHRVDAYDCEGTDKVRERNPQSAVNQFCSLAI